MVILQLMIIFSTFLKIPQSANGSPFVYLNGRSISGKQNSFRGIDFNEYLGIPYAEPPVGPLRFQKPKPIRVYPQELEALSNPPACPQYTTRPYPWYINFTQKSEDCLYLNIWTPSDASPDNKKAVLFWIHGGGLRYGSIRDELYSGIPLASQGDIIVVTVNYRLGVLGFLTTDTEDAPPNVGLYDILEGLKWVNENIEAFGGDVRRITIAGESAGSRAVGFLSISPLAKGLYTRLIMESGSPMRPIDSKKKSLMKAQKIAKAVGCSNETYTIAQYSKEVVECLRGKNTETLLRADFEFNPYSTASFGAVFGDDFLPDNPATAILKGNFRCKDLLIGSNKDEGSYQLTTHDPKLYGFFGEKDPQLNKSFGQETVKTFIKSTTFPNSPSDPETILQHYFGDLEDYDYEGIREQAYTAMGDMMTFCTAVYYAEKCAEQNQDVYYYYFTHRPSTTPWSGWMGVAHFEEVQFVFGRPLLKPKEYRKSEVALSRKIIRVWSTFVKTGKTDGDWPLYSRENPTVKYLQTGFRDQFSTTSHQDSCNLLRILYE